MKVVLLVCIMFTSIFVFAADINKLDDNRSRLTVEQFGFWGQIKALIQRSIMPVDNDYDYLPLPSSINLFTTSGGNDSDSDAEEQKKSCNDLYEPEINQEEEIYAWIRQIFGDDDYGYTDSELGILDNIYLR